MAMELTVRHGTIPPPRRNNNTEILPSPDMESRHFKRQFSETEYSPMDTPRKNKRKLSEPKRRTTDFSIKRLCPDSPGSACSESGRSEESTPERGQVDPLRDSPDSVSPPGITNDKESLHSQLKPPFVFPDLRHHPYFIPQFYCNRFPSYPGNEHLAPFHPGLGGGIPTGVNDPVTSGAVRHINSPSSPDSSLHNCVNNTVSKASHKVSNVKHKPPSLQESFADTSRDEDNDSPDSSKDSKKNRKNYKNMTRERRVEANARERSRVHTISAAFEGLRRAVPSYSYNQKLSKLAILRIACTYINALSKLAEPNESCESAVLKNTSFAECVDNCTRTIQTEGKARRRH